jgi:LmbE family N-acetylglucosaminyl deacetylase
MSESRTARVALVIVAHPDDAEFGCAGTVTAWVRDGWSVFYVLCIDASGGGLATHRRHAEAGAAPRGRNPRPLQRHLPGLSGRPTAADAGTATRPRALAAPLPDGADDLSRT